MLHAVEASLCITPYDERMLHFTSLHSHICSFHLRSLKSAALPIKRTDSPGVAQRPPIPCPGKKSRVGSEKSSPTGPVVPKTRESFEQRRLTRLLRGERSSTLMLSAAPTSSARRRRSVGPPV